MIPRPTNTAISQIAFDFVTRSRTPGFFLSFRIRSSSFRKQAMPLLPVLISLILPFAGPNGKPFRKRPAGTLLPAGLWLRIITIFPHPRVSAVSTSSGPGKPVPPFSWHTWAHRYSPSSHGQSGRWPHSRWGSCFPLQQEGGIDDDQHGAGVMDQSAYHRIQNSRDGQNNRKEIQRHGEGEVTFDGEHHPA